MLSNNQLRPQRSLRPKIAGEQEVRTNVFDGTDVLADYAYTITKEQLIPKIVQRSTRALTVNPKEYYYYMRKTVGRKCSCTDTSQTAEGQCPICWHTGFVGGYNKYGTITEILDVTYPNTVLVNIEPNFNDLTRPTLFKLNSDSLEGYITARLDIRANKQSIDYLANIFRRINRTSVTAYIKTLTEPNYVLMTSNSLNSRLSEHFLYVKIIMTRVDSTIECPVFSHLVIRYKVKDDLHIIGDAPRRDESVALHEFGIYENFSTQAIYFDSTIKRFNTFDWLYRLDDTTRWKMIELSPNRPLGITTSTLVTTRLVQVFDTYTEFPI